MTLLMHLVLLMASLTTQVLFNLSSRLMNLIPATEAAQIMIAGMERNQYRVLVGKDATIMDRIYRLNPAYAAGFIYKKKKALLSA